MHHGQRGATITDRRASRSRTTRRCRRATVRHPPNVVHVSELPRAVRALADTELCQALRESDDIHATAIAEEIRDRYRMLIVDLSRQHCRRLGHRGGACPGFDGCGQAFIAAYMVIGDRFPDALARHLLDGRPRPRVTLGVNAHGMHTEILRRWNSLRGLIQRPRPKGETLERLNGAFAAWHADSPTVAACEAVGLALPVEPQPWIDALHADACQPASSVIDTDRVLRHLFHEPGGAPPDTESMPEQAHRAVVEADRVIADTTPRHHDQWLGAPRGQTRVHEPLTDRIGHRSETRTQP